MSSSRFWVVEKNGDSKEKMDSVKFGPAPEGNANSVLLIHFVTYVLILNALKPPFVSDGTTTRHLLILVLSAAATFAVSRPFPVDIF